MAGIAGIKRANPGVFYAEIAKAESFSNSIANRLNSSRARIISKVFFHPGEIAEGSSLVHAAITLLLTQLVSSAAALLGGFLVLLAVQSTYFAVFFLSGAVSDFLAPFALSSAFIIGFFIAVIVLTVLAAVPAWLFHSVSVHVIANLLGGKGSFKPLAFHIAQVWSAINFFSAPLSILSGIPCIGEAFRLATALFLPYAFYLEFSAVKKHYGLTDSKAFIALTVSIWTFILAALLVLAAAISAAWFFFKG